MPTPMWYFRRRSTKPYPAHLWKARQQVPSPWLFDSGGQSDIISHRTTGYLARPYDTADLAAGMAMGLEQPATAETLRSSAERFRASEIASRYLRIIDEA